MAIDAIDTAVMTTLLNDATLTTLAPGRVHRDFAPEGTSAPFVIVNLQTEFPVDEFGGHAYLVAQVQVKAVDQATTTTAAQTALDRCDALLNGTTLTIAGHTALTSKRIRRFGFVERDGELRWQHRGADYEVWADPV